MRLIDWTLKQAGKATKKVKTHNYKKDKDTIKAKSISIKDHIVTKFKEGYNS